MDKIELGNKIRALDGLTHEEKSALIELLHQQKKYGLVWEDKPEAVEERLRDELPVFREVKERAIISEADDAPNHILIEGDKVELCALPAAIYDAYKQVLPKRKPKYLPEALVEDCTDETKNETVQGKLNFDTEGGEA